jgi:hypothetical protein
MMLEKLNIHMQSTETRSLSFMLYQNQLILIKDLRIRPETLKMQELVGNTLEQTSSVELKNFSI